MRIVFLGTPGFAVPTLDALAEAGHDIVLVVTRPDAPSGRGRSLTEPPVKAAAQALGAPVFQPRSVNAPDSRRVLAAARADVAVVVAYGEILRRATLDIPRWGFLNVHASLLPRYRGAAPINWAIICGETQTGVTVQRVVRRMDAGAVLGRSVVEIGEHETAGELHDRLAALGGPLLVDILARMAAGADVPESPQDEHAVTYAPKLSKSDGRIDWSLTADQIRNRVRGLSPWPGARCRCRVAGRKLVDVTLLGVDVEPSSEDQGPGVVVDVDEAAGILVRAGRDAVRIRNLKPAGSHAMSAADFVHGRHVAPGDRFV